MIPLLLVFSDWSLLLLRLVLGFIFILHGWPKIKNLKVNAQNFEMMGFKPGAFWGTIVAVVEFFGGLFMVLGLATQLAALLIAADMAVATIWIIKRGQKFIGGFEFDLLLAAAGLALATLGAGLYSLDNFWQIRIY